VPCSRHVSLTGMMSAARVFVQPPAAKARPMSLKMRRQMQLKQMRLRQVLLNNASFVDVRRLQERMYEAS
jgi:hypothetical protein